MATTLFRNLPSHAASSLGLSVASTACPSSTRRIISIIGVINMPFRAVSFETIGSGERVTTQCINAGGDRF